MMPILHSPGVMTPGQFGPTRRLLGLSARKRLARAMSSTGMPSVMAMMTVRPASAASRMASAAPAGGTKIMVAVAPVREVRHRGIHVFLPRLQQAGFDQADNFVRHLPQPRRGLRGVDRTVLLLGDRVRDLAAHGEEDLLEVLPIVGGRVQDFPGK